VADFAIMVAVAIVEVGLAHGAPHLSQVGRHHKLGMAWLDRAVTVEHLNRSASTRHIFNQPGVVRAIPGVAFGLKGPAYSVAILEYGVAHDALLREPTLSTRVGSKVVPSGQHQSVTADRPSAPATIFATQLPKIGWDWKVSVDLQRLLEPNKINHFGMKAYYSVRSQANCKTVYTSSILVVASIPSH
jgi:hypothetical protein